MAVRAAIRIDTKTSNRLHVVGSSKMKLQFGATIKKCFTAFNTTAECVTNMCTLVVQVLCHTKGATISFEDFPEFLEIEVAKRFGCGPLIENIGKLVFCDLQKLCSRFVDSKLR